MSITLSYFNSWQTYLLVLKKYVLKLQKMLAPLKSVWASLNQKVRWLMWSFIWRQPPETKLPVSLLHGYIFYYIIFGESHVCMEIPSHQLIFQFTAAVSDYIPLANLSVGYFNDSSRRQCFNVYIVDDKVTEIEPETFSVSLSKPSTDDNYYPQIEPREVAIAILDNDCKSLSSMLALFLEVYANRLCPTFRCM